MGSFGLEICSVTNISTILIIPVWENQSNQIKIAGAHLHVVNKFTDASVKKTRRYQI